MPITDPTRQFDSRTVRRKIKSGRITESDYSEFLETLPDLADNIRSRDDGGDDDGYEERIANRGRPRGEPAPTISVSMPPASATAAPPMGTSRAVIDDEDDDDDDGDDDADDLFSAPVSPSSPLGQGHAPKPPVIAPPSPSASPLRTPSFDLPPLDPPSSDDGE